MSFTSLDRTQSTKTPHIVPKLQFVEPRMQLSGEEWMKVIDEYIVHGFANLMALGRNCCSWMARRGALAGCCTTRSSLFCRVVFSFNHEFKAQLVQHPAPANSAELRAFLTRVYRRTLRCVLSVGQKCLVDTSAFSFSINNVHFQSNMFLVLHKGGPNQKIRSPFPETQVLRGVHSTDKEAPKEAHSVFWSWPEAQCWPHALSNMSSSEIREP